MQEEYENYNVVFFMINFKFIRQKETSKIYILMLVIFMKKNLIPIILCIVAGISMGKVMFNQYDKDETKPVSANPVSSNLYFVQVGVYSTIDNMKNAMNSFDSYIYIEQDGKYYVYIGITSNEENLEKLKGYFESRSYNIYVKEITVENNAFLEILSQYDQLLKEADNDEAIEAVIKGVLAKYEELVINDKD